MDMLVELPVVTVKLMFSAMFMISATQKFSDNSQFRSVLAGYHVVPRQWLPLFAMGVPALELTMAIALLSTSWSQPALIMVAVVLLLYLAVMGRNLLAGRRDIDCGCSGASGSAGISGLLLLRNGMLSALALIAWAASTGSALGPLAWVFALLGAVALLLLFHACNQLIANHYLEGRVSQHA